MKIMLGINTYNRKNILEKSINSLKKVKNINEIHIGVYDDKSTEYNIEFLENLFPNNTQIIRREENLKADKNMYMMYKNFLKTNNDYLIQVDSDMIYNENFINIVKEVCKKINLDNNVVSLYNSNLHETCKFSKFELNGIKFIEKINIGGACVIFSKQILHKIINDIKIENNNYKNYDYRWSKYLLEKNIKILVSKNSYVQHIGFEGQNTRGISYFDLGYNFIATNTEDIVFLFKFYEDIIKQQKEYYEKKGLIFFIKKKIKNTILIKQIIKNILNK